jgi:hypothetical protein
VLLRRHGPTPSRFDRVVALVTILTALAAGVLFGDIPALQASYTHAQAALRHGGNRGGAGVRTVGRTAPIVAEVALTLVLPAGAVRVDPVRALRAD